LIFNKKKTIQAFHLLAMQEQNKHLLQHALGQLPAYEPPMGIWEEIQTALDADQVLQEQLPGLPIHTPPDAIWDAIEHQLPKQPRFGRVLFLRLAAAAVLLGMAIGMWWLTGGRAEEAVIVQTQEIADPNILETTQAPEDSAFLFVQKFCETQVPICQDPAFEALKTELDELSEAKEALRTALGSYSDDPALAEQMIRIERERSALLQQIMQLI
jgi:hypothetical protein